MLQRDAALFFPSRFEANMTALSTLGHEDAAFFVDEGCHPSLRKGSLASSAHVEFFPHGNVDSLEEDLEKCQAKTKIIVSESIFSLTGKVANLPELIELANHFDALLYIDDSHAFGVVGVEGMGLCAHFPEIDIISGSFSKACGAYGGYLVCSEMLRDYLVNLSPPETTYLFPPPIIGAIEEVLELIPQMEGERKQLEQRSHWLREALRELDFDLPRANTPLLSLLFESPAQVEILRNYLKEENILVGPTRSFEGERGSPRMNIALNVCHMPDHLTRLIDTIKTFQANHTKGSLHASQ